MKSLVEKMKLLIRKKKKKKFQSAGKTKRVLHFSPLHFPTSQEPRGDSEHQADSSAPFLLTVSSGGQEEGAAVQHLLPTGLWERGDMTLGLGPQGPSQWHRWSQRLESTLPAPVSNKVKLFEHHLCSQ